MPQRKKDPSTRRRRNRASTAATLVVDTHPSLIWAQYESWTVKELRAEIARINEDRDPEDQLSAKGTKKELIAALTYDENPMPQLPVRRMGWHERTEEWWREVWLSPMSKEWHLETDKFNVEIAAMHLDDVWAASTAIDRQKAYAMFAKAIMPLGLTPYDRRRLEWSIETAEEAKDRGRRRRSSAPINGAAAGQSAESAAVDPRALLSVVT